MAVLMVYPSSDEAFAQLVDRLALEGGGASDLEAGLRTHHPQAVVRSRGLSGEREAWYVYRDGKWVAPEPH